jgi:hypothetical protein
MCSILNRFTGRKLRLSAADRLMARYHFGMHNDDNSQSKDLGIQVLSSDIEAISFAERVIKNILHQSIDDYSEWSIDIAMDARVVASVRFGWVG